MFTEELKGTKYFKFSDRLTQFFSVFQFFCFCFKFYYKLNLRPTKQRWPFFPPAKIYIFLFLIKVNQFLELPLEIIWFEVPRVRKKIKKVLRQSFACMWIVVLTGCLPISLSVCVCIDQRRRKNRRNHSN